MDGIDGYAASEAIFIGLGAYCFFPSDIFLVLAAAAAGFLLFNWQKASIFMGDSGSTFLGFVFGLFALYYADTPRALWIWLVLTALFWMDATLTLLRRYRNGEKLSSPHRKHAYQRLHQAGLSHARVVMLGMLLNLTGFALLCLTADGPLVYAASAFYILLLYAIILHIERKRPFDRA
jgi:Fuc2NAc and GlcNAc transferase